MKAVAVWPARRKVGVLERAAPALDSDSSVRLRVLDVGVCGTDAEICRFDYGGTPPAGEDHLVVGHEALGQVIETGSRVSRLRPGDLVAPQTVLGTVNAGRVDFESAVVDLGRIRKRWPGTLEALITGRYPMERFCERASAGNGIKDVIAVAEAR